MYYQIQSVANNNNESSKPFRHLLIFLSSVFHPVPVKTRICALIHSEIQTMWAEELYWILYWNSMEQESEVKHCKQKESANTTLANMFYSMLKYT